MKRFMMFILLMVITFIGIACGKEKENKSAESIEIISSKTEVYVGDQIYLTYEVMPSDANKNVEWDSSDKTVATVDNHGRVNFKNTGTVTIICSSIDNKEVKDEIVFIVSKVELEKITINGSNKIGVDNTQKLIINATPENANVSVEWSSSDVEILEVNSDGIIKGIKEGTAIITAVSVDDANIKDTLEIEVIKEVEENYTIPESIKITGPEAITLGYTGKFKAEIYPLDANQNVVWESLDTAVLTIDENGVITPLKAGTTRIRCTSAVDGDVKSNLFKVTVKEEFGPRYPDLKGYKIVIMTASSSLKEIDPFLDEYKQPDKMYKQKAWWETEKALNCTISVEAYPSPAPWGSARIQYIIDNAKKGTSVADLSVVSSNWISEFVEEDAIVDVTEYYNKYVEGQIETVLKEAGTRKGKLYVATTGISKTSTYVDLGLYYNLAWTEKLGVKDPAEMFNDGEWNYSGFKAWCLEVQAKLNSENGEYAIGGHPYYYWFGMTNAAGVKVVDSVNMVLDIENERSKDASSLIYELVQSNAFDKQISWAESDGGFIEGKTVMSTGYLWFNNNSARWKSDMWGEDTRIGYVPFPYPDDVLKEDTRISQAGLSVLVYNGGREDAYLVGVTFEKIYYAVSKLYLNIIKYQEQDSSFDEDAIIEDSLSSYINHPASIEAIKFYTNERVFFDPHFSMYTSISISDLVTPAINVMINGKDYDEEYNEAVKIKFKTAFESMFG